MRIFLIKKFFSYLECELLKDYNVIMYRVYMNSSMTALINTSSGEMETLKCNESKWYGNYIEQTTTYMYNGKLL